MGVSLDPLKRSLELCCVHREKTVRNFKSVGAVLFTSMKIACCSFKIVRENRIERNG